MLSEYMESLGIYRSVYLIINYNSAAFKFCWIQIHIYNFNYECKHNCVRVSVFITTKSDIYVPTSVLVDINVDVKQ